MHTTEIKNNFLSTKTVRNDLYLTAIINTQEQEIQRLKVINNELIATLPKHNVSYYSFLPFYHFSINPKYKHLI